MSDDTEHDSGDTRFSAAGPDMMAHLLSARDALHKVQVVIEAYAHQEPISAEKAMDQLLGIAAKHPAFVKVREGL